MKVEDMHELKKRIEKVISHKKRNIKKMFVMVF